MAKPGQETTLRECDANIAIYYRIVKKRNLEHGHHVNMMNKSLDRRLELMGKQPTEAQEIVATGRK